MKWNSTGKVSGGGARGLSPGCCAPMTMCGISASQKPGAPSMKRVSAISPPIKSARVCALCSWMNIFRTCDLKEKHRPLDRGHQKGTQWCSMNQQHRHAHEQDLEFDWRGALASIPMIALFWFTGPLLLIAWLLQRWASASIWRAQDRWASLKTLAWMLPLLYIPVGIFRLQLALLWAHLHLPGDFLLWPPTFSALFARSILALPLAPVLTLILERSSPRTLNIRYMLRRPRPGEVISYQSAGQDATITPLVSAPARATPRQLEQKKEQPAVKAKPAAARSTSRARSPRLAIRGHLARS